MNRLDLMKRVRSLTRDLSDSIFREIDLVDYINEGIERCQQYIAELRGMTPLLANTDIPTHLPAFYHHVLAVYATARCFGQDERHYQATTHMNEFETKLDELKIAIQAGEIKIVNPDGTSVGNASPDEYVVNKYFSPFSTSTSDIDDGVDGVE